VCRLFASAEDVEAAKMSDFELKIAPVEDVEAVRTSDVELKFWPKPLAWDGICLTVKSSERVQKHILKGCYGEVLPGEMMAIVGPSGENS
jgi:hypothetical protein